MRYKIPALSPDLHLNLLAAPDNEPPTYGLSRSSQQGHIKLSGIAVGILMLCDGMTTVENILKKAGELGLQPPEGFFEQLVGALANAGFAALNHVAELPHKVLPGTHQTCQACGRSCEGRMIGPLPTSEARTILDVYPELQEKVPRLQEWEQPIVKVKGKRPGIYLRIVDGRCVFLDDDRLCALHKHYDAETKPSICRNFPFLRVADEDGLRLGVSGGCFRHHSEHVRATGDVETLPKEGQDRLPPDLASIPPVTRMAAVFAKHPLDVSPVSEGQKKFSSTERLLLNYLSRPDATLSGFAVVSLGGAPDEAQGNRTIERPLLLRTAHVAAPLRAALTEDPFYEGLMASSKVGLAASLQSMLAGVEDFLNQDEAPEPIHYTRREEEFILDHLHRLYWLRTALRFSTPQHAAAALIAGWVWAVADSRRRHAHLGSGTGEEVGREETGEQAGTDSAALDARFDDLGEAFTTWYWAIENDGVDEVLFESWEDAVELLRVKAMGEE